MSEATYLCGGINGLSDSDCKDWRAVATELLSSQVIDPMRRDYRGREDDCVGEIVEGDLSDIAASHYILVNATRPSWGTAMEIRTAWLLKKKICCFVGTAASVSPWLRYHSDAIVASVENAVAQIESWRCK